MTGRWVRFTVAWFSGLGVAIALNFVPYWRSYQAYNGDGYEIIGFPFVFRRMGGYVGIYEFRTDLLIANALIAILFAALAGWAAVKLSQTRRFRRGFPVVRRSDGGPAADE